MPTSTRSNNSLRIVGFIAALASFGTACGGATTASEPLNSPTAVPGIEVESIQLPASDQTTEQASGSDPGATAAPTPPPAPIPDPGPEPEPPAEPNVAPVIDAMTVSRHGLEVTVELSASDADNEPLTLSVVAVNDQSAKKLTLTEQADAHTFTFNFEYMGSITLVGSVTDGHEEATNVDHIDIATLKMINIDIGRVWVAPACLASSGEKTYYAAGDSSVIGLSTGDFVPTVYSFDTVDTTMTFEEPDGQLFLEPLSLEFEQNVGSYTYLKVDGQFRDIVVEIHRYIINPGYSESTFWSPSNDACWLKVAFNNTVTDA
jgi:hypothetical protein